MRYPAIVPAQGLQRSGGHHVRCTEHRVQVGMPVEKRLHRDDAAPLSEIPRLLK